MPEIKTFLKGINQATDKQLITLDEAYDAQNCDISDGLLRSCNGSTLYSTATLSTKIGSLMAFYHGDIVDILAASNGSIYKLVNNVWVSILIGLTSDSFDYVNYQEASIDLIIFTNGIENVKVYDGTTIRDLKNNGAASVAGALNVSPKGKFIELHKERLWISGGAKNTLYFGTPFEPDDWTVPTDAIQANQHGGEIIIPTWDGGSIIGLKTLFNDVLIFKTKNVFKIFGTYPGNYDLEQIFNTVNGKIIDKTIKSVNNIAFWATNEGMYLYDAVSPIDIKEKVKNVFSNVNQNYMKNAVAEVYKNKYILAVPEGSSTVNNLIVEFDFVLKNYMIKRGIVVSDFLKIDDKLIYADGNNNLCEYNVGSNWNGVQLDSYWLSGDMNFGMQFKQKKINKLVHFVASGNGSIKVSCDNGSRISERTILLTSNEKMYHVKLKNKGVKFSYKFENLNGSKFVLKEPQIDIEGGD